MSEGALPQSEKLRPGVTVRVGIALGLIALAALLVIHARTYWVRVDDAYIAFRYAENLSRGSGLVFNLGERVEGYTDFLWVLLLAAVHRAGAATPIAAQVLGALCGLATLVVVYFAGRRCLELPRPIALAACALVAVNASVAMWMGAGLETVGYGLLFTVALGRFIVEVRVRPPFPWSGLLFGLAALTRPEAIGLFVVAAALSVRRVGVRYLLRVAAGCAVLVVPHFIFRLIYYGELLPNTAHAKLAWGTPQLLGGLAYAKVFAIAYAPMLLLAPLGLWRRDQATVNARLAGSGLLCAALYVVAVGGDFYAYSRFFAPYLPWLILLFCLAAARLGEFVAANLSWKSSWVHRAVAVALALSAGALAKVRQDNLAKTDLAGMRAAETLDRGVAAWLRRNHGADTLLAVNRLGEIPYLTGFRTLDMLGLIEPKIARSHRKAGPIAHQKSDPDYVLSRKPDVILVEYLWSPLAAGGPPEVRTDLVARDIETAGTWAAVSELLRKREFRLAYAPRLLQVGKEQCVVFVRDPTLRQLQVQAKLHPRDPKIRFALARRFRLQGLLDDAAAAMQEAERLAGAPPRR